MTPEAVIHRYLQLANAPAIDVPELERLIATDADLFGRWLVTLNVAGTRSALLDAMSKLDASTLYHLAHAQAWSVLPVAGSARLGFDQWQAVLQASFLGEALAEATRDGLENDMSGEDVRRLILLAISGVQSPADADLSELIEFRGAPPELLADAGTLLRVFAVIDAMEDADDNGAGLAQRLLGLGSEGFAESEGIAEARCAALLQDLQLERAGEEEWADRLWVRQQIYMLSGIVQGADAPLQLHLAHRIAARSLFGLFGSVPLLFLATDGGSRLTTSDPMAPRIRTDSTVSGIAQAARQHEPVRFAYDAATDQAGSGVAIADRQVLRRLGVEAAVAWPLIGPLNTPGGVIVFAERGETDTNNAMAVYVEEIQRWLHSPQQNAHDDLSLFQAQVKRRLHELVHEANNPLSIVQNYLHILELRLQDEPGASEQLDMIGSELKRAQEIITQMRSVPDGVQVNRGGELVRSLFDVNQTVRRIVELHRGYADQHAVEIDAQLSSGELRVASDEDKVSQVLTNLLRNAIEACTPDDQIDVRTVAPVYRNGRVGLELLVDDNGPGMDQSTLGRLFLPKTSTKGGEHAGLGLNIVHTLVNEMGGAVDLRTAPGEGATFSIFLPLET